MICQSGPGYPMLHMINRQDCYVMETVWTSPVFWFGPVHTVSWTLLMAAIAALEPNKEKR